MRMVKLTALAGAAALCLSLLTACGKDASSVMPSPTPMPPATTEEAHTPETAPSTAEPSAAPEAIPETDMGYTAAGLTRVLDGFVAYESGTAGGSLKAAIAAADLVRYTAQYGKGHDADIRTDAENWKNGLDADKKALLDENWPDICYTARSITEDPEKTKGMLADAGVTEDFSGVDLETASAGVDILDEVFGGTK